MADNIVLPHRNPGSAGRQTGIALPDAGNVPDVPLRTDPGLSAPAAAFGAGAGLGQAGEKIGALADKVALVVQRQQKEYDATRTNEALLNFEQQGMDAYQKSQTQDDPSRAGYQSDLQTSLIGARDPNTGELQVGGIAGGILDNLDPNVSADARQRLQTAMERSALSISSAAGRLSIKASQDKALGVATQLINSAGAQVSYYPDHADTIAAELDQRLADFDGTLGPANEAKLQAFRDKSIGRSVIEGYARAGRYDDANAALASGKYDAAFDDADRQALTREIGAYQTRDWVNAERQRAQTKQDQQDKSEAAYSTLTTDILKDPTKFDPARIANDPNLKGEQKLALSTALHAQLSRISAGRDVNTYGSGFWQLYQDIHRPAGDPQRITDPTALYSHAGPDGDLTLAGVRALTTEIQGKRTPEGEAESLMKKTFLADAKRKISGATTLPGGFRIQDPKGEENYLRFLAQALPAMDKAQKDGQLSEVLNPDGKDSLYGLIGHFKRSDADRMRDMLSANEGVTAGAAPSGVDLSSPKALVQAVHDNKISRAQGEAIALRNHWIRPSAPPPAVAPQVPVL